MQWWQSNYIYIGHVIRCRRTPDNNCCRSISINTTIYVYIYSMYIYTIPLYCHRSLWKLHSFLSWMLINLLPWVAFLLLIKVSDVATNMLWDALFTTLQSFVTRLACQESSYHAVYIEVHWVVVAIFRSVFLISLWNSVEQLCAIFYNYYQKQNT